MTTTYKCYKCTEGNDTKPCQVIIDFGTMEHTSLCVANGHLDEAEFKEV